VNNLKQVGLSFRLFATDNQDTFPMSVSTNQGGASESWPTAAGAKCPLLYYNFTCLSNELGTPKVVACPSDSGRTQATNFQQIVFSAQAKNKSISYFVGKDAEETQPQMLLTGDRNLTNNGAGGTPITITTLQQGSIYARLGTNHLAGSTQPGAGYTATIHQTAGNVCLGDGSVQQATTPRLREQLRNSNDPLGQNNVGIPGETIQ
jgi:hypothetical protein